MSVSKAVIAGMILVLAGCAAWGQNNNKPPASVVQQKILRLPAKTMRLDSLGAIVARQTGFIFSFNARKIDPGLPITVPAKPLTVQTLLELLSNRYQLRYNLAGHYIIFQQGAPGKTASGKKPSVHAQRPLSAAPALTRPSSSVVRLSGADSINGTTTARRRRDSVARPSLVVLTPARQHNSAGPGTSPRFTALPPQGTSVRSFRRRPSAVVPAATPAAPGRESRSRERVGGSNGFFMAAGMAADDVFYVGPTVQAGLPWLYLTAKWNTNFDIQGLSYGVGSSLRLSDDWNAALEVTMGPLSRSYTSPTDTLRNAVNVKGSLLRFSMQAEKQLGDRWLLRVGPVVNHLHTAYYHKGKLTALARYYPPGTDIEGTYYLMKPLYTIRNSYKTDATSNNKIWVGVQLSLFYRFLSFNKD